jgi:hypothetical protein
VNNKKPITPADLRSLCRSHTETAVNTLVSIMRQVKCPPAARSMAATALLDRGWGRPSQAITGEDGGELRITIRQLVESTLAPAASIESVDGEKDEENQ